MSFIRKLAAASKKAAKAAKKAEEDARKNLGGNTSTRGKPKDTPKAAEADRKRAASKIKDRKNKEAAKTVEKKGSIAKRGTVSKTDIKEASTANAIQAYIRKIEGMKDGLIKQSLMNMANAKLDALRASQASDVDAVGRKSAQANRDRTRNTKENVSLGAMMDFSMGGTPAKAKSRTGHSDYRMGGLFK